MRDRSLLHRVTVILLVVIGVIAAAFILSNRRPRDFAVYMLAAERIVHGDQIYRPDDPPAFTYPPFFALPFVAYLPFPPRVQLFLWSLTNLGLLAAVLAILSRWISPHMSTASDVPRRSNDGLTEQNTQPDREGRGRSSTAIWAWVIILVLSARFLVSPIEYHAHDLILLVLVLLGGVAAARGGQSGAGAWVGLATACKATPLLFLPVFAEQRRWRACAALVAVLITATLLPDMVFPNREGEPWAMCWYENFVSKVNVGASPEAGGAWARWDILNQSLPGTLYRLTSRPQNTSQINVCIMPLGESQLRILTLVLEALIVVMIGIAAWPRKNDSRIADHRSLVTLGQFGAVLCGMLLLSPMSSKHHFCTLVVPIAFCVVYVLYHRRDAIVIAGLVCVFCMGTLGAKDLIGDEIGDWLQACGSLAICSLACLIATSWALLRLSASNQSQCRDADEDDDSELPPDAVIKLRSYQKSA